MYLRPVLLLWFGSWMSSRLGPQGNAIGRYWTLWEVESSIVEDVPLRRDVGALACSVFLFCFLPLRASSFVLPHMPATWALPQAQTTKTNQSWAGTLQTVRQSKSFLSVSYLRYFVIVMRSCLTYLPFVSLFFLCLGSLHTRPQLVNWSSIYHLSFLQPSLSSAPKSIYKNQAMICDSPA